MTGWMPCALPADEVFVDLCAGHRLATFLRSEGHDVEEARDRGRDPGDQVLLEWAVAEQRVLVTMDKDFGELVFFHGARHHGLVRLPDVPAASHIALMRGVLEKHVAELAEGAVVTVRGGRIRISRPP